MTPGTVAQQAVLSMEFPRQEHWSGLLFPAPGYLPDPGIEAVSPALAGVFFTIEPPRKPIALWSIALTYHSFLLHHFYENFITVYFISASSLCANKVKVNSLSHVRLFATPWTVAHQAPPSMGFSRQEYWSGLPFPSPGDLPNPGMEPRSPAL